MTTKKLYRRILVVALTLFVSAVSSAPVFGDIVSTAEATPAGFPLYTWGNTANGRLGRTPTAEYPANRPARMGDGLWIASSTAASGAYAINASGHLYAWGAAWSADQMGQGGINPGVPEGTPMRIGTANNWVQVSGVANGVSAINSAGHLYTWGANSTSPTGFVSVNVPTRVGDRDNWIHVVRVGGSGNTNFAINDQGHLYSWGTGNALGREVTAAAPAHLPGRVGDRSDWINVDGSSTLGVGVTEDGEIYSWGTNTNGLGRAVTVEAPANRPGRVGDRSDWVEMVTSFTINVAAINEAGELWTWGEDAANGQLGRPATAEAPANRPGRVGTASNWVTVAGGNSHFLAINTAGELWGWGNNSNGQVGDGTSVNRLAPEFVVQTTQASHAARGSGTHSMMLIRTTPAEGEGMLTKNLDMPYGTPTPDLNFTFIVAAHSFNGNTAQANLLPTIPNRVVSINNTSESGTSAGITTLTGEIDVLAGILFSQSGVFSYTVTEQQNTSGATSPSTVTYSQAQYRLNIYVQQDFEAPGEVFEIVAITVYRHINDNGTAVAPPEKDLNGLIFTNQYRRTTSGTTEYPGGLRLTKTVAGEFADRTTPFDFDVTLTRTALCPPTSNFQARIYNADGTLNSTVPITSGVSTHLTLGHRQSVIFQSTALPASTLTVGTGFTITERAAANFVASVELYVGDNPVTVAPNTLPNTALSTGARIIGDSRNSADFTNAHLFTPPVGLISGEVAPLAIAALAAVLIATAMIAINRRKRIERLGKDVLISSLSASEGSHQ